MEQKYRYEYKGSTELYSVLPTVDLDARIEEKPFYVSWCGNGDNSGDSITEEGKINYDGLKDAQKLCLYIFAWNKSEILPSRYGVLKRFSWTNYKLQKIIKSLKGLIITEPTFSECTGLLSGRGYYYCG